MKANETKVDKFLATNETAFAIPVYQRNYDWTLTQCGQLLRDIFEAGSNERVNAHFIGSIVYVHDDVYTASGMTELTIIDGQQRLTTITLIYIALYRLARQLENKQLENRIHKTYLINEFASEEEKLKLKPTDNNKQALKHILNAEDGVEFKGYSRIIENFNFFKSGISKDNYEIVQKGLAKLIFVDIALDRQKDNPQRIFESLNSTGLELSQADLIRNYILMGLSRRDQEDIYRNYWEVIESNAKDETLNKSRVSDFIRDYLTLINKEIPNKGDVYIKFKAQYPTTTIDELKKELSSLKSLVRFYNKLINPKNEPDEAVRIHLEYINRLEINVAFPFLMKVYEDFSNGKISKQTFIDVLSLVQSFTWRRFMVSLPTNALNKIFMNLYDKVEIDNYLYSIQKSLLIRTGVQRFPRNAEIINALKEKDVYTIKPKNRTYLFERLENFQNNEVVVIDGNVDITVEHIFPQNPDHSWKTVLGTEEYNFIKENYLNIVGNLTLSGNNGRLGNKSFLDKREMNVDDKEQGYKYSRLWLNRSLKEKEKWGREEIEHRTELIAERFLKVWEIPDIQIELEATNDEVNIFDADAPKHRKLEYAIFFDQKLAVTQVAKLYIEVFKQLFELQPETFFASEIGTRISLSTNPKEAGLRQAVALNGTYFMEANIDNMAKFDRIKQALTIFGFEDELFIKYANGEIVNGN
ncbi:DUF262 domain-containing protein [Chitinophaga nivalis]|uniref:DUF262 domain-containing protein n=1 Tax=Chitinophaga nivalis TaxID=2991709 RepID=A0ABT3IS52_9BACT|nr:DUF262 domain-containing protein [Chitinophaga nivalis]MCW3463531.1 DUF262 domain-containing protein [Chitinophaga nivalis]MCW3486779.1 DUF262 domain-containing protein [Chitinophaga nivalis]